MEFEVELWSNEESAVKAVRATLEQAPINAKLEERDGRFFVIGSDFTRFACEQQGYVKRVLGTGKP
jgi:hypothetical protein